MFCTKVLFISIIRPYQFNLLVLGFFQKKVEATGRKKKTCNNSGFSQVQSFRFVIPDLNQWYIMIIIVIWCIHVCVVDPVTLTCKICILSYTLRGILAIQMENYVQSVLLKYSQ